MSCASRPTPPVVSMIQMECRMARPRPDDALDDEHDVGPLSRRWLLLPLGILWLVEAR
jgi:hypothetical protein